MAELTRVCLGCGRPFAPVRPRQTCCRPSCRAALVYRRRRRPLLDLAERAESPPAIATPVAAEHEPGDALELTLDDLPL